MAFVFHNWKIYTDARQLRKEIFELTKKWPPDEKYNLRSQINRATTSIMLQIAEGSNRKTDKDKALFFNRSHTSVDEVVACLDVALDNKYITKEQYQYYYRSCEGIAKQFRGLSKYLKQNSRD